MWQDRAHQMIAEAAKEAYLKAGNKWPANLNKKHKPYTLPKWCDELVECMKRDDEERAKAIMNWEFLRDY